MGDDLSVVYPRTHNDLAASEVGPLSNWDRPCMENEGWGGGVRIHNTENDVGIIMLRLYTTCHDPTLGTTTRVIRSARGLARHGRKKSSHIINDMSNQFLVLRGTDRFPVCCRCWYVDGALSFSSLYENRCARLPGRHACSRHQGPERGALHDDCSCRQWW